MLAGQGRSGGAAIVDVGLVDVGFGLLRNTLRGFISSGLMMHGGLAGSVGLYS